MTPKADTSSLRRLVSWLGLGLVLFWIYLFTASQQYDPDVLGELRAINRLDLSSADPAHMLYIRLGVPFYRLWLALGYQGDALAPMQVLNAFFGAGTIMMFALALRHWRVRWPLILLVSTGAGLSYAFWTHTVDAFFIIPAAFFAITSLICALSLASARSPARRTLLTALLGISLGLAALGYQANLTLIPALLAASWPSPSARSEMSSYVRSWIAVGGIFALLAGGVWIWQAIALGDVKSPQELFSWFLFGHGGMDEGLWRRDGVNLLTTLPVAWLATILPVYEGLGLHALSQSVLSLERIPAQLALILLGLIFVVVVLAFLRRPALLRSRVTLVMALWFLLAGIAVTWFDPAEVKLWLIPMFGFWALSALALQSIGTTATAARQRSVTVLMATLALLIALGNFLTPVWPNHRTPSRNLTTAQQATAHLTPTDLVVSATFDWTGYLNHLSDDCRVFNAVGVAQSHGKPAVKIRLQEAISATHQRGGHVYMVDYFGPDHQRTWESWVTPFTWLTPDDFVQYERTAAWQTIYGDTVWELSPRP